MQFYELNDYQFTIFRLYTVYNKHGVIKIGNENQRKIASTVTSARIILLSTVCNDNPDSMHTCSKFDFLWILSRYDKFVMSNLW